MTNSVHTGQRPKDWGWRPRAAVWASLTRNSRVLAQRWQAHGKRQCVVT